MSVESAHRRADWLAAHRMYVAHRDRMFIALFARSLPATFCSPTGAATLDPAPHGYGHKSTRGRRSMIEDSFQRLTRTMEFLDEMFFTDGLPPAPPHSTRPDAVRDSESAGGSAFVPPVSYTKGRLLDLIRSKHDGWRVAIESTEGVGELLAEPISQMHLIGACASFVVSVRETFERRWDGGQVAEVPTSDDWDAWTRTWVEISDRQGLDRLGADFFGGVADDTGDIDLARIAYRDLARVSRDVLETNFERTLSGVRLLDNLRMDLEDGVPLVLRPLISVGLDVYGDPRVNRLLLLRRSPLAGVAEVILDRAPKIADHVARRFVAMVVQRLYAADDLLGWEAFAPPTKRLPEPTRSA